MENGKWKMENGRWKMENIEQNEITPTYKFQNPRVMQEATCRDRENASKMNSKWKMLNGKWKTGSAGINSKLSNVGFAIHVSCRRQLVVIGRKFTYDTQKSLPKWQSSHL